LVVNSALRTTKQEVAMKSKIQDPARSAPVLVVVTAGYVEVLTLIGLSGGVMAGLFRAVAGLRGADEEEVNRAGHRGFVVGALLGIAVGFLEAI